MALRLFGRKKSLNNIADDARTAKPPPVVPETPRTHLRLPSDIQTPLFAKFASASTFADSSRFDTGSGAAVPTNDPAGEDNHATPSTNRDSTYYTALFGASATPKSDNRQSLDNSRASYFSGLSGESTPPTSGSGSVARTATRSRAPSPSPSQSHLPISAPSRKLTKSSSSRNVPSTANRPQLRKGSTPPTISHPATGTSRPRSMSQSSIANSNATLHGYGHDQAKDDQHQAIPMRPRNGSILPTPANSLHDRAPISANTSPSRPSAQGPGYSHQPPINHNYVTPDDQGDAARGRSMYDVTNPGAPHHLRQHPGGRSLDGHGLLATQHPSPSSPNQTPVPRHGTTRAHGSTPPVTGAPIQTRQRRHSQSLQPISPASNIEPGANPHNLAATTRSPSINSRAPSMRSPSPAPTTAVSSLPKKSPNPHRGQLPTPPGSSHNLSNPSPQSSFSNTSHPPVSSSGTWTSNHNRINDGLARGDSVTSSLNTHGTHTTFQSDTSSRTSMTSLDSGDHPSLHHAHQSITKTSGSWNAGRTLLVTPEKSMVPPTTPKITLGHTSRLSEIMLQDIQDPFARDPPPELPRPQSSIHSISLVPSRSPSFDALSLAPPSPALTSSSLRTVTPDGARAAQADDAAAKQLAKEAHRLRKEASHMRKERRALRAADAAGQRLPLSPSKSRKREKVSEEDVNGSINATRYQEDPPYGAERSSGGSLHFPSDMTDVRLSGWSLVTATTDLEGTVDQDHQDHDHQTDPQQDEEQREPEYYPLIYHLIEPDLLSALLPFFSFREFVFVWSTCAISRKTLEANQDLREIVLTRYLKSVGYRRWSYIERKEPLIMTLRDLNSYMRGVSIPTHQYAEIAEKYLASAGEVPPPHGRSNTLRLMASSSRAYSKLVLRLRAQAEMEATHYESSNLANGDRAPPYAFSMGHTSESGHGYAASHSSSRLNIHETSSLAGTTPEPFRFRSPLIKLGHAPLLRLFVPSAEGQWLSDESVLACERELKRAGLIPLLKPGDVVWDIAVGDEGNAGRMVWDGNYLIDLDYTYSIAGEVPQYMNSLCFSPSYWHRVIRVAGNPICYIDISPYAPEIAQNLKLIQDRVQTETPQGHHHTVIRWIHRTSFQLQGDTPLLPITSSSTGRTQLIDPAWEGTVIIEAEGTNEGLEDLQRRCGDSVRLFPVKAGAAPPSMRSGESGGKTVFRLMRGNSRPGELWLRCVRDKEQLAR